MLKSCGKETRKKPTTERSDLLISADKVPMIRSMLMAEYPTNLRGILAKSIKVFYRNFLNALVSDDVNIHVTIPTSKLDEEELNLLEHMLNSAGWSVVERDRDYYKVVPEQTPETEEQLIMLGKLCPYCHVPTRLDCGFWECPSCMARVECHPGTTAAMGFVANDALRKERNKVHDVMDRLWINGGMKRSDVYYQLRQEMKLTKARCHIAKFDEKQCRQALKCLQNIEASNESKNARSIAEDSAEDRSC